MQAFYPLENAKGQFAHKRLTVCRTFTCNNERRILQKFFKADSVEQKVDAGTANGIQILQESVAQASGSSCTGYLLTVVTKAKSRFLCKSLGTFIKLYSHFRRCSLLWCKHMGTSILTTKGIRDIGGYGEADIIQSPNISPRTARSETVYDGMKHPHTAVACGTTAKPHNDVPASSPHSVCHYLACSITGSYHRIALPGAEQHQSAGFCNLYNSRLVMHEILRMNSSQQRVFHKDIHHPTTYCCLKSLQPSFAAIADRNLHHLGFGHLRENAFCG